MMHSDHAYEEADTHERRPTKTKRRRDPAANELMGDTGLPEGITVVSTGHEDELEIQPIETSKDLIEQPELAKDDLKLIPSRGY